MHINQKLNIFFIFDFNLIKNKLFFFIYKNECGHEKFYAKERK